MLKTYRNKVSISWALVGFSKAATDDGWFRTVNQRPSRLRKERHHPSSVHFYAIDSLNLSSFHLRLFSEFFRTLEFSSLKLISMFNHAWNGCGFKLKLLIEFNPSVWFLPMGPDYWISPNWSERNTRWKKPDNRKVQNLNCYESYLISVTRDSLQIPLGQLQQSTTTFIITLFHCTVTAFIQDTKRGIQAGWLLHGTGQ